MSDNKATGQFPFPGAAVILLALGVFIYTENPFQTTRPDVSNNLTTNTESVRARLWQDPFEAVQLHKDINHSNNSENINNENHNHTECYIVNNEIIKNKDKINITAIKEDKNTSLITSTHDFNDLHCNILQNIKSETQSNKKHYDLHVIAVMVTGGPYAEDKELRIRSRYALTTGIMSTGYNPVDSEHIGYIDFSKPCIKPNLSNASSRHSSYCDWPAVIPYEYFNLSSTGENWSDSRFSKNILVLWLDDEIISKNKPLDMLSKIQDSLTQNMNNNKLLITNNNTVKNKENISLKFDVIGPASSTTLVKMYKNLNQKCNKMNDNCSPVKEKYGDQNKIRIFSPRATLDNKAITRIINKSTLSDNNEYSNLNFPGFHRTISTDSLLVDSLLCEMLRRGVNPFHKKEYVTNENQKISRIGNTECTDYSLSKLNTNNKNDYIALIGEWDTTYSRNFERLFREKIIHQICQKKPETNQQACKDELNHKTKKSKLTENFDWLYSFNYLRGLDGEISKNNGNFISSKNNYEKDKDKKTLRRSAGANQFDYLRRLAKQIKKLSESKNNIGTVRAIGIVGSDTYDKLLILQALRAHFPDVLFFTTDLDARMLHQSENEFTRNLIVASAFGLTPDPKSSGYIYHGLAFRDSYQTSLYNTVQKTVNNNTNKSTSSFDLISPVKIFEIGNKSAIDYTHNNNPDSHNKNIKPLYIFLSVSLIILLLLQSNNAARIYIFTISIITYSVLYWASLYNLPGNTEFHFMLSGTSVWPAYIIRMTAAISAIVFIIYTIIALKINAFNIIEKNKLSDEIRITPKKYFIKKIKETGNNHIKKYLSTILYYFKWHLTCDCYNKKTIENRKLKKPCFIAHILITTWGWKDSKFDKINLDNIFYQYIYLSKPLSRLSRVTVISILYLIISMGILSSFPNMPVTPFVGKISADASSTILFSLLIPYVFLIFLVSDVTRLNLRFVELLSKYNVIWPDSILNAYCDKYGLSKKIAIEKLKLDIIVKRSKIVDKLIFLPFIILTLMILSRSNYFDRWDMPPQLAFIILLGACVALSSAIRLRRSARKARFYALKNLNKIYKNMIYTETKPKSDKDIHGTDYSLKLPERLKLIISDIENISTGPFAPITKHPIISAVALPFGGVGSLYIIEYLSKINL